MRKHVYLAYKHSGAGNNSDLCDLRHPAYYDKNLEHVGLIKSPDRVFDCQVRIKQLDVFPPNHHLCVFALKLHTFSW